MNYFKKVIVSIVVAVTLLTSYSFVDNYFEVSKNLDIFATLFRELNIYYVDETKPGELMKEGIDAMLESLDPYTNFIPESEIEDYRYMTTGQYGGIGSLIRQKGDYVVVAEPYEGFPAQKADLRAGDAILEIDGISAKGKRTDEVSKILKGQPGTSVSLLINREGEVEPLKKILVREDIKVNSVSYYGMLDNKVGYIKLTGFTENASEEVKDAYMKLKEQGPLGSLVLDLRGNPGGLLKEAVNIVNLFVDRGTEVVSTKGKIKDWDRSHKATKDPIDTKTPMVVLVDRGSASASEIVSGAIQDLDRGVVIGQKTFGKGLVQQTRPLSYNAQLKVTVAKYYIPSGRCIQALDYSNKNDDGSVDRVPDSLITAFKTKNGRIVYDGGGITPDMSLENKRYSNISSSLVSKSHVFDFATQYRIKHEAIADASEFALTDEDYQEFVQFLQGKEYDYTTRSEKALDEFKEMAKKEKYFDNVNGEFEALEKKIIHNKKDDLTTYKKEITELLEEEIASRYYYQKGRLAAAIEHDAEVDSALVVLGSAERYSKILTTIGNPTHPFNEVVLNKEKGSTSKQ